MKKENGLSSGVELRPFSDRIAMGGRRSCDSKTAGRISFHFNARHQPPIEAALFSWRQPGLGHRACDDVTLNSCALRARKGSQVLAQRARLDRRQLHGRTASHALRTLISCVEHAILSSTEISPQFGARKGLQRHRADTVCSVTRSVRAHVTQSKVQRSKPAAAGLTKANTMGPLHLLQRRCSILLAAAETGNDGDDAGMRFPCFGRERYTLSHR
jgi:hypothetical protein